MTESDLEQTTEEPTTDFVEPTGYEGDKSDYTGEDAEESDVSRNSATTPFYNQPEDADRYPVEIPAPLPAHTVFKGNPQIDGPYLDDVREAQADARRRADDTISDIQRKHAEESQEALENLRKANELLTGAPVESPTGEEDNPNVDTNVAADVPEEEKTDNSPPTVPAPSDNTSNPEDVTDTSDTGSDEKEPWE